MHVAWRRGRGAPGAPAPGPRHRVLEAMVDRARSEGRTTVRTGGWESPPRGVRSPARPRAEGMVAVNRRQFPAELDRAMHSPTCTTRRAAARLVVRAGPAARPQPPTAELAGLAEMTAAINDAPTDDLDIEDEVYTPERIRAYEDAQSARGYRLYRVFARHRGRASGRADRRGRRRRAPAPGAAARHVGGARAPWPPARDCCSRRTCCAGSTRPSRRSSTIDTWNAESNDHMIGVNEALGYRIMGRELEFQRKI